MWSRALLAFLFCAAAELCAAETRWDSASAASCWVRTAASQALSPNGLERLANTATVDFSGVVLGSTFAMSGWCGVPGGRVNAVARVLALGPLPQEVVVFNGSLCETDEFLEVTPRPAPPASFSSVVCGPAAVVVEYSRSSNESSASTQMCSLGFTLESSLVGSGRKGLDTSSSRVVVIGVGIFGVIATVVILAAFFDVPWEKCWKKCAGNGENRKRKALMNSVKVLPVRIRTPLFLVAALVGIADICTVFIAASYVYEPKGVGCCSYCPSSRFVGFDQLREQTVKVDALGFCVRAGLAPEAAGIYDCQDPASLDSEVLRATTCYCADSADAGKDELLRVVGLRLFALACTKGFLGMISLYLKAMNAIFPPQVQIAQWSRLALTGVIDATSSAIGIADVVTRRFVQALDCPAGVTGAACRKMVAVSQRYGQPVPRLLVMIENTGVPLRLVVASTVLSLCSGVLLIVRLIATRRCGVKGNVQPGPQPHNQHSRSDNFSRDSHSSTAESTVNSS